MQRTGTKYTKALSMAKIISHDKPHVFLRMKQARQRDQEWDGDKSAEMSVDESDREVVFQLSQTILEAKLVKMPQQVKTFAKFYIRD